MSKKNIYTTLTSLALLTSAQIQADDDLSYSSLGSGIAIRDEILSDEDGEVMQEESDDSSNIQVQPKKSDRKKNNRKSQEQKCGVGTCENSYYYK